MSAVLRAYTLIAFAAAATCPARADTPATQSCPPGAVSIYFAAGDVVASPEARAVLGKVAGTANECQPARVEVVAHINADEGDRALSLALERLTMIAQELSAQGLPASHIRMTAEPSRAGEDIGPRQVDILFLKQFELPPRGAETSAPRIIHQRVQDI